jgi:hypothetical protein
MAVPTRSLPPRCNPKPDSVVKSPELEGVLLYTRGTSGELAVLLNKDQSVSRIGRVSFLVLAFAVFCLGLQARLALYKASPPIHITSAKLATEKHSAKVLESLEVQRDGSQPMTYTLVAFFPERLHDEPRPVFGVRHVAFAISAHIRSPWSTVSSLRRPPPSSI